MRRLVRSWFALVSTLAIVAVANACSSDPDLAGAGGDGSTGADSGAQDALAIDGSSVADGAGSEAGPDPNAVCKASPLSYAVTSSRGGDTPVYVRGAVYDYAPSVMKDGATYRMWWCGGVAGDYVLSAEATAPGGPWHKRGDMTPNSYDVALQPTGNTANFDGTHTCDPSVIRIGGTYYMYYGGAPKGTANAEDNATAIGLATSADGVTWSRANGGQPIVTKAATLTGKPNAYGAGQPSVTFANGKYYLLYTDTSAPGSNASNGAGVYVLRSADPTFQSGVEELGAGGFAPFAAGTHGAFALQQAFSVDWMYAPEFDLFILAQASNPAPDGEPRQFNLHFYSASKLPAKEGPNNGVVSVDAHWREGAGLITTPDRRSQSGTPCNVVPIDLLRPVGPDNNPFTYDLAYAGWDVTINSP